MSALASARVRRIPMISVLKAGVAVMAVLAATPSMAANYVGDSVSKVLSRAGKDLDGVQVANDTLTTRIYEVKQKLELQRVQLKNVICPEAVEGDGSGSDWNGFFNVPKANKVDALSDLIQGVGPKSAEYLVATNAFARKPRSWAEFADIIVAADQVLRSGFSKNVLVKFEAENKKALGYDETRADCRVETKVVDVLQTVDVKVPVRVQEVPVRIEIANAPLLAGESEEFKLTTDGFTTNLSVSSRANQYKIEKKESGYGVTFRLTGIRNAVTPQNLVNLSATRDGSGLQLTIDTSRMDPEVEARGAATLTVEIVEADSSKIWGSPRSQLSQTFDLQAGAQSAVKSIPMNLAAGNRVTISYSISYANNPFYSGRSASKGLTLQ